MVRSAAAYFVSRPPRPQAAKFVVRKPHNPREKQRFSSRSRAQRERFLRSGQNKITPRLEKNRQILRDNRPLLWKKCSKRKNSRAARDPAKFAASGARRRASRRKPDVPRVNLSAPGRRRESPHPHTGPLPLRARQKNSSPQRAGSHVELTHRLGSTSRLRLDARRVLRLDTLVTKTA